MGKSRGQRLAEAGEQHGLEVLVMASMAARTGRRAWSDFGRTMVAYGGGEQRRRHVHAVQEAAHAGLGGAGAIREVELPLGTRPRAADEDEDELGKAASMEAEEVSDTTGTILWSGRHGDDGEGVAAAAALGGDASDRSLMRRTRRSPGTSEASV
jgi:hypothetical protein